MSNIVAEFQGSSFWSTGGLGGAIRWADILLFRALSDETDEQDSPQALNTASDIYSFGSVMLEVCADGSYDRLQLHMNILV